MPIPFADRFFLFAKVRYLLVGTFLLSVIAILHFGVDDRRFAIVVDAGSSGSRCHIYSHAQTWFLPELKNLNSIKVEPGISSLNDITEIEPYLADILDFASKMVPKSLHPKTPILFYATAGMRLLPKSRQIDIMRSCCDFFIKNSKFFIPNCKNFKVISGKDEGIYGWLTVNYLKKSLSRSENRLKVETFGFLDMGGASLQIAFEPTPDMVQKHADDLSDINLFLADGSMASYRIFVTTFLGFGANEARRRYLESKIKDSSPNATLHDDCLMNGHQIREQGVQFQGTGDYLKCIKEVSGILNVGLPCPDKPCFFNGVHIPMSNFTTSKIVGVSEFWYTSTNVYDLGGLYNATAFFSTFKDLCSSNWTDFYNTKQIHAINISHSLDPFFVEYQCFKSSWIYNFLHNGLLLSTSHTKGTDLEFINEIGNVEVSWTLGAILVDLCSNKSHDAAVVALKHWTLGLVFLILGFIVTFSFFKWLAGRSSSASRPFSSQLFSPKSSKRRKSGDNHLEMA